eukprot:scaffold6301_cov165-Amphora_coffeaeformis.AAC.4
MADDLHHIPPMAASSKTMASPKYKKAPDAPKRFKSAFIIFSAEKHKEIKARLAEDGRVEKTTDIAKMVSEAWRELNPEEKEVWEKKARKDKARYEVEKAMYKGPWKVPANKRTPKDPSAPKRPMSAFLAFSNKRRAALKRQHPDATNADLSKMLSKTWKEAEPSLRQKYMDEEAELRSHYKVEMAKWRKKVAEEKRIERKEREALAMQAAESRSNEVGMKPPADGPGGQEGMQQQFAGMYNMPYGVPQQGLHGDMGYGGGMQGQYPGMLGGGAPFGGMNAPMGAQQQLLSQLLAGQQMNQFSMGGRPPMMYGQGGQGGQPSSGAPGTGSGQQQPQGYGMPPQGMGSAGGNFGMDGNMSGGGEGQMPQGQGGYGGMQGYEGQYGGAPQNYQNNMGGESAPAPGGDDGYQRANL